MKILIIFLILFWIFVIDLFGQTNINDLIEKSAILRIDGKPDEGLALFNKAIESEPNNAEIYRERAIFCKNTNKLNDGFADISKAISLEPDNTKWYLDRAEYFSQDNNSQLKDIKIAITLNPNDHLILQRAARTLLKSKQYEESIKVADSIIALDKTNYWGYNIRYKGRYELKDYVGALEDAIKSIELIPVPENKFVNKHSSIIAIGNIEEFQTINIIISEHLKNDKNLPVYYDRLITLFDNKITEFIENAIPDERMPIPENTSIVSGLKGKMSLLLFKSIDLHDKKKDFSKVETLFEKLIQLKPPWQGYLFRANYFVSKNKYKEAISDLTNAIDNADINPNLFQFYRLTSYLNVPNYYQWKAETLIKRGDLYILLKQYKKAIGDFELSKSNYNSVDWKDRTVLEKLESKLNEKIKSAKQEMSDNTNIPITN